VDLHPQIKKPGVYGQTLIKFKTIDEFLVISPSPSLKKRGILGYNIVT